MEHLTIVPMAEAHLAALAEIERLCFAHPWSAQGLRDELGHGLFLVALQGDAVCGYIGCQTVLDEGYITNVAVHPNYRRRGVAQALLHALHARAAALAFITLEVRQSNAAAIALYTQAGYQPVGARKKFYSHPTEDALLMTRFFKEIL